jgi:hypothetical protein
LGVEAVPGSGQAERKEEGDDDGEDRRVERHGRYRARQGSPRGPVQMGSVSVGRVGVAQVSGKVLFWFFVLREKGLYIEDPIFLEDWYVLLRLRLFSDFKK